MSLDRLINLAKRTGDRLIVHDAIMGRDVVILDLDSYERLLDKKEDISSEDIPAPWDESPKDSWHKAGGVLVERYSEDFWDDVREHVEEDKEVSEDVNVAEQSNFSGPVL